MLLVAGFGLLSTLRAEEGRRLTLDEVLQRLETNLDHYDSGVPSLFCDEHVRSLYVQRGSREEVTNLNSIFRLMRSANPDHTTGLVESREIHDVDGRPAAKQQMDVPTLLEGAFEGGLAVVSRSQTACMRYALQPSHRHRADEPYVVRFATALTSQNAGDCLLQEESKGRVVIDPASMQIVHLELTTPHHTIIPDDSDDRPVVGERVITVDYAPVLLGNAIFWMPSIITLRATSGVGSFHAMVWSYRAIYGNYHKVGGDSRIVPGSEVVVR
jgi:hypothetical protein